eukprot:jgi/Psemu1/26702/gm1.26702_g
MTSKQKQKQSCHTATAAALLVAAGLLSLPAADALVSPVLSRTCSSQTRTTSSAAATAAATVTVALPMSSFDRGWDNDNFLESLGSGGGTGSSNSDPEEDIGTSDAIERANDEYYRQSRYGRPPPPTTAMSSVTDAAAEIYSYSYNKDLAPEAESVAQPPQSQPQRKTTTTADENAFTTGAQPLPPEAVARIKASHEDDREEASQGGARFRALMERAKQQQHHRRTTVNPLLAQTQTGTTTPPSQIMTPEEIAGLSIDEQARLYREFFYVQQKNRQQPQNQAQNQQQNQAQTQTTQTQRFSLASTDSNYLAAGTGFDGRKIGRNRDSDAISNASDVYFARLKRDSTTRNLARYRGDDATANDVFHDPSIAEIEAPVNPYLEEQRKRMMDVVETVPEEMLLFREFDDDEKTKGAAGSPPSRPPARASGVSYRERVARVREERRAKKKNNPPGGSTGSTGTGNPHSY